MTRKEQLFTLRGRDLIALCEKLGVKVNASRNSLKEAKAGVIERILAAESASDTDAVSTPLEDSVTDDTDTAVETERPEENFATEAKEIDLAALLRDVKRFESLEFSSNIKSAYREDGSFVGTIIVDGDTVSLALPSETTGLEIYRYGLDYFKSCAPKMI